MLSRCFFTVPDEISRLRAIATFEAPVVTKPTISAHGGSEPALRTVRAVRPALVRAPLWRRDGRAGRQRAAPPGGCPPPWCSAVASAPGAGPGRSGAQGPRANGAQAPGAPLRRSGPQNSGLVRPGRRGSPLQVARTAGPPPNPVHLRRGPPLAV